MGIRRHFSPEGGEGGLGENGEVDTLVGVQPPHHGAGYTDDEGQDHQQQGCDAAVALYGGYRRPARLRHGLALWQVYFGPITLGWFDEELFVIFDTHGNTGRNPIC